MRNLCFLFVVAALALFAIPTPAQQTPAALDASVQAKIQSWRTAGNSGDVYIYAKNLDTGADYAFHPDTPVPTASTIKLPVMIEVFYEVQAGKLDLHKMITLHDSDKIGGSGILQDFSDGDVLPLFDVMTLMIDVSDNTGTNLVLGQLNGNDVNARMASLGLEHTAVMRDILEPPVYPDKVKPRAPGAPPPGQTTEGAKPENKIYGTGRSCPRDMVTLLDMLYHDKLVSKDASEAMLKILKQQLYHYAGRDLANTEIANKSGGLDHLRSDAAIIYTPHGAIAMSITVNKIPQVNYSESNPGAILISDLSEVLINGLATPPAK